MYPFDPCILARYHAERTDRPTATHEAGREKVLAGDCAGNPLADGRRVRGPRHRAFEGRMLVTVPGRRPCPVTLQARAGGQGGRSCARRRADATSWPLFPL